MTPLPKVDLPRLKAEPASVRADLYWAAGIVLAFVALFLVLNLARGVAGPVLISLAFAYVLDPVADFFEARKFSRTLAVATIFVITFLLLGAFLIYLVPAVGAEVGRAPSFVQAISGRAIPAIERLIGSPLPHSFRDAAASFSTEGSDLTARLLPSLGRFAQAAVGGTWSVIGVALGILVVPVMTFFFLRDYDRIVAYFKDLLPAPHREHVSSRFHEIDTVLSSFVHGQLIDGAILATIYSIGLSFAGVDLAVVIGLIGGFGNLIPYVGTAVGVALALLSTLVSWQGPWQLVVVLATFAGGQALDALVIAPRVVGRRVGLTPVAVIVAVLAFGEIFGFVGVMLAVPTTAALKVVARVLIERYRAAPVYTGSAEPP
jgi:predicted PurR-regulated permease PerM